MAADRDGNHCTVPAPQIAAIDTTGAGDAFLAAFLLARLSGATLADGVAAGVKQGAQAAGQLGGRPPAR